MFLFSFFFFKESRGTPSPPPPLPLGVAKEHGLSDDKALRDKALRIVRTNRCTSSSCVEAVGPRSDLSKIKEYGRTYIVMCMNGVICSYLSVVIQIVSSSYHEEPKKKIHGLTSCVGTSAGKGLIAFLGLRKTTPSVFWPGGNGVITSCPPGLPTHYLNDPHSDPSVRLWAITTPICRATWIPRNAWDPIFFRDRRQPSGPFGLENRGFVLFVLILLLV